MDESNQYFRATLLARETVARLQREGHSADEAKRLVAAVIDAEEFALMKGRHSFDEARFSERLQQLPEGTDDQPSRLMLEIREAFFEPRVWND